MDKIGGGKKEYLRFCEDLEDSCDCMQNHPSLCLCLKHTVMFQLASVPKSHISSLLKTSDKQCIMHCTLYLWVIEIKSESGKEGICLSQSGK